MTGWCDIPSESSSEHGKVEDAKLAEPRFPLDDAVGHVLLAAERRQPNHLGTRRFVHRRRTSIT